MNTVGMNVEEAISALQGGDPSRAKAICEKLLSVQPEDAVALQVLGLSYYHLGDVNNSLKSLKRSFSLDSASGLVANNIASILQEADRIEEAMPYAHKATELDPRNADAFNNFGMICRKMHDFRKAEGYFTRAIRLDKSNPMFLVNLGELYIALERLDDSERILKKALMYDANSIPAKNNLGIIFQKKGNLKEALKVFNEINELVPGDPEVLNNIGIVYLKMRELADAKEYFQQALKLNREYFPAYINLANLYLDLGEKHRAIELCESVLQLNPNFVPARRKLAEIYKEQDRFSESVIEIRNAIQLESANPEGYIAYAEILEHFGKLDLAEEQLSLAVEKSGGSANMLLRKAAFAERSHQLDKASELLEKVQSTDKTVEIDKKILQSILCRRNGQPNEANQLLNNLVETVPEIESGSEVYLREKAKNLEKLKKFDEAIEYYKRAAKLRHTDPVLGFSKERCARSFDEQIKFFTADKLAALPKFKSGVNQPGPVPVFIVGFPRSGTTLLEQILCSHPKIIAGDELEFLNRIVDQMPSDLATDKSYPICLESLIVLENRQEIVEKWRNQYLDQALEVGLMPAGASFFTDKMPLNLNYLPLIAMIFPDSPVIHMMRNPMDSVLSSVFSGFSSQTTWAHNLEEAAYYFTQTLRLANHNRERIDMKYMLLRYEDLVSEQQLWSRKIIEFLGIEWNDRCLDFHETKRVSKTASYEQVTRKIYRTSVARYKNYEKHLAKQLEILEPAMEQFGYLD